MGVVYQGLEGSMSRLSPDNSKMFTEELQRKPVYRVGQLK